MGAYDIHAGDDLYARLKMLQAGDTVTVHDGTYTTPGFYEVTWAGTSAAPIVIQAAPGEHPVLQGQADQNVINITGAYFTLDGFEIRGGSHGLRLRTVSNSAIKNNKLHDLGDVGISCNFEENCDTLEIRHNEIYDTGHAGTGEGMYLGCNDGSCHLANSIVANNYVHDMGGSQGDGIEIKTSSYNNLVIDNVVVRSNYPGITMYGFLGNHPPNVVTRNLVWHAKADNGIQVAGQIIVTNNVVIDSAANGIQSKATAGITTSDVTIAFNTIVGAGAACLKTNDWGAGTNQILANNAAYCDGRTAIDVNGGAGAGAVLVGNRGLGSSQPTAALTVAGSVAADFLAAVAGNTYPAAGSPLIDHADAAATVMEDFNGTVRTAPLDVGAYEVTTATNPGWIPTEGFKDPLPVNPGDNSAIGGDDTPVSDPDNGGGGGCCQTGSSAPSGPALLAGVVALSLGLRRRRR
ncbi:MAG: right-handed parallel beta-helix repeat-containing protein [Kofleriaceae bacterium]